MRTRVLLAAVLAIAATGCIVHTEVPPPPPPIPGDITVQWSFSDGNGCFDINRVNIAIPGQFSQDFNCLDGAEVITNFDPGSYQVTVTAINSANQVAYQGTTDFVVNGDVHVNVVMTPQIVAVPGNVTVLWTFQDGDNCIGIDHIHINIPNEVDDDYSYNTAGTQGITLTDFNPGGYSVTVTAVDTNGSTAYQGTATFTVNGDVSVPVSLTSVGVAGDLTLLWTFPGGVSCSGAGVDHVVVTIPGENLGSGAGVGVAYNCNTSGTQGVTLTDFAPGAYGVTLSARTAGETELYSSSGTVEVNGNVSYTFALQ